MSEYAPSKVELIILQLKTYLQDGPAVVYDSFDEVIQPEEPEPLSAIVITPIDDDKAEDPENYSVRNLKVLIEIIADQRESVAVRTILDRLYVWAITSLLADQWVNGLAISITEGRGIWDFPSNAPGSGYRGFELDIRYPRSVEDPTQ